MEELDLKIKQRVERLSKELDFIGVPEPFLTRMREVLLDNQTWREVIYLEDKEYKEDCERDEALFLKD
jgi:hypothetical protein